MNGDVGMHHAKKCGNKKFPYYIKDTSTTVHNPPYIFRQWIIVLVSFIVLLRRLLVSTIFRVVHPYITILHSLNDFALVI